MCRLIRGDSRFVAKVDVAAPEFYDAVCACLPPGIQVIIFRSQKDCHFQALKSFVVAPSSVIQPFKEVHTPTFTRIVESHRLLTQLPDLRKVIIR